VRKSIRPHKPQIVNILERVRSLSLSPSFPLARHAQNSTGGKCGAPKLRLHCTLLHSNQHISSARSFPFAGFFFFFSFFFFTLPHMRLFFFFHSRLFLIRVHAHRYLLHDTISPSRIIYALTLVRALTSWREGKWKFSDLKSCPWRIRLLVHRLFVNSHRVSFFIIYFWTNIYLNLIFRINIFTRNSVS